MPAEERYHQFVKFLDAFVAGHSRSREQVAAIENEFALHFDNDPRFVDLEYELAMYGADDRADAAALAKECQWALELLRAGRRPASDDEKRQVR